MANSYTQLHMQFIFAVKYRQALVLNDGKIASVTRHYPRFELTLTQNATNKFLFLSKSVFLMQ